MSFLQALILAIIEGLTEFLPVSSTGHMIIGSSMMGIATDPFVKLFTICIQLGAILSVVVLYFKRFFKSYNFYLKLFVAFIPAAIFGLLLSDKIDEMLESPLTVAVSLVIGGVILLFVDKWFDKPNIHEEEEINYLTALKIGFFGNVVAFIVALLAIKSFIGYLNKNGFKIFGWYRIIVGLIIIALILSGHQLSII